MKKAAVGGLTAGTLKGVGNKFAGRGFFDSGVSASTVGAGQAAASKGLQATTTGDTTGVFLGQPGQFPDTFTDIPGSIDASTIGSKAVVPSVDSLASTPSAGPFDYVKTPFTSCLLYTSPSPRDS